MSLWSILLKCDFEKYKFHISTICIRPFCVTRHCTRPKRGGRAPGWRPCPKAVAKTIFCVRLNPNQNPRKYWGPSGWTIPQECDCCPRWFAWTHVCWRLLWKGLQSFERAQRYNSPCPKEFQVEAIGLYFCGTVLSLRIFSPVFFEKLYNHFMLVQFFRNPLTI